MAIHLPTCTASLCVVVSLLFSTATLSACRDGDAYKYSDYYSVMELSEADELAQRHTCKPGGWAMMGRSEEQCERLRQAKPLYWLHPPKTGTSFGNTVLESACPPDAFDHKRPILGVDQGALRDVLWRYPLRARCHGAFSTSYTSPPGHVGLGGHWGEARGRAVAMFRQPEQRILSGWKHGRHSARHTSTIEEYIEHVEGCQVKLVVRPGGEAMKPMSGPCGQLPPPSSEEVRQAIDHVWHDFVYVGLMDEYALSVCLWHAMFGGDCHDGEFTNTRPGRDLQQGVAMHDPKSLLKGWTDQADGKLYAAVSERFSKDLKTYGVSPDTCRSHICPAAAGRFLVQGQEL